MRKAGQYAAHILQAKPAGALLSGYPLLGLPQPVFDDALRSDAVSLSYAAIASLGEALKGIRDKNYTWSVVKSYYASFYALKANLALDKVVVFYANKSEYITDVLSGYAQEFGRSSHQFSWTRIRNIRRIGGWVYSDICGETFAKLRELRENASYKESFYDPDIRPELRTAIPFALEKSYRTYKNDTALFYTFLDDHLVVALPIRMCVELAAKMSSSGLAFNALQQRHLARLWPFTDPGLW